MDKDTGPSWEKNAVENEHLSFNKIDNKTIVFSDQNSTQILYLERAMPCVDTYSKLVSFTFFGLTMKVNQVAKTVQMQVHIYENEFYQVTEVTEKSDPILYFNIFIFTYHFKQFGMKLI